MSSYLYIFLPAVLVAVLIRVDAIKVGPYFATSSLVPGFGGMSTQFLLRDSTLRFALVRRLAYPVLMGVVLNILQASAFEAALAGLTAGFLLSWPAWIAPNPPAGVSYRDFKYHLFYFLLTLTAGALTTFGFYFVVLLKGLSGGDVTRYVLENAFVSVATLLASSILAAFTKGIGKSLSEKADRRIQTYGQVELGDTRDDESES